jgi:hypothetical protein
MAQARWITTKPEAIISHKRRALHQSHAERGSMRMRAYVAVEA